MRGLLGIVRRAWRENITLGYVRGSRERGLEVPGIGLRRLVQDAIGESLPHELDGDVLYFVQMFSPERRNNVDTSNRLSTLTRQWEQAEKPPRQVQLGTRGRIFAAAVIVFFAMLVWGFFNVGRNGSRVDPVDLIFFVAMIVGTPLVLKLSVLSWLQRRLLRDGAYSIGKVVVQQRQRGGLGTRGMSRVVYEFSVGGHRAMTGRGVDWTSEYKVDSPILVFFDADDISKHVALCSTVWRVRTKEGVLLEP
jgi:hypothetical protein